MSMLQQLLIFAGSIFVFGLAILSVATAYYLYTFGRRNEEVSDQINVNTQIIVARHNANVLAAEAAYKAKEKARKDRKDNLFPINRKPENDKDPT